MSKYRKALIVCLVVALAALGLGAAALAQKKVEIRVSGQPTMHGMPTWMAMEDGWIKDKPFEFKYLLFPSGAPQVEAMAAGEWDVGAIGTVPMMMSSIRYGAMMIGISNDESETNDMWVRPDSPLLKTKGANPQYPEMYGKPEDWKGKKILVTTVSTGHYALTSTLKAMGLKDSDVQIVGIEQGQAIAAFDSNQGDIIQLWAPFSYVAEGKGWKKVSSGKRAGVMIPGAIIVRKEYAEKNPNQVVEWLDVYMKAVEKMKADPQNSAEWLKKYFNDYCGLDLPKEAAAKEFQLRPLFDVKEQIEVLTNPDKAAKWMTGIAQFFVDQKRIKPEEMDKYLKANCFIEPKFMKMLAERRAKK